MRNHAKHLILTLIFILLINCHNELYAQNFVKHTIPIKVWNLEKSKIVPIYVSEYYNHQPNIVNDVDNSYLVVWVANKTKLQEGAKDQIIYASRSYDAGNSWTQPFAIFQDKQYTYNPVIPNHSEWQPRSASIKINGLKETWIAYNTGRGQSSNNGAYVAIRNAKNERFIVYKITYNRTKNEIMLVEQEKSKSTSKDSSNLLFVDGRWWFPYPQSIQQLSNNTIMITLTLISLDGKFQEADKRFAALLYKDGKWQLSGVAPLGNLSSNDVWESSVYQSADGQLIAYIRSNDIKRPRGYRLAESHSFDGGLTWSSCTWAGLPIHTEQPSIAYLTPRHSVLTMPDHGVNRNNRALMLLGESSVTFGLGFSEEIDGIEFAHTSYVAFDKERGKILTVWSQSTVGSVPNKIYFRSINSLPSEKALNLIPRNNAAYELNDTRHAAHWNASEKNKLNINGRASAGLELPEGVNKVNFHVNTTAEKPKKIVLQTFGTYFDYFIWEYISDSRGKSVNIINIKRDGSTAVRKNVSTQYLDKNLKSISIPFYYDSHKNMVNITGKNFSYKKPLIFFLGDGYLTGTSKPEDAFEIDLSKTSVTSCLPPNDSIDTCITALP